MLHIVVIKYSSTELYHRNPGLMVVEGRNEVDVRERIKEHRESRGYHSETYFYWGPLQELFVLSTGDGPDVLGSFLIKEAKE